MSLYRDRQNGWPMTPEDILDKSNQRMHADARHMVTYIMLEHVCEDVGVERLKLTRRGLAAQMKRDEKPVRHSYDIAKHLLSESRDFREAYSLTIDHLLSENYTLVNVRAADAANMGHDEQRA